jgi:hypothetical protein
MYIVSFLEAMFLSSLCWVKTRADDVYFRYSKNTTQHTRTSIFTNSLKCILGKYIHIMWMT